MSHSTPWKASQLEGEIPCGSHPSGAVLLQHGILAPGAMLAYYRHPPTVLPDSSYEQHLLLIHLDVPATTQVEQVTAGTYQTAEIGSGDIILIPARTTHRASWNREHEYLALWLAPETLEACLADAISGRTVEVLPQFVTPDSSLYGLGLALKGALGASTSGDRLYVDAVITAISARLLRNYSNLVLHQPIPNGLPAYQLEKTVEYIHAYLDRNISLAELADIARISPNYFLTLFKQSTGLTPHQYLIHQRIERAKVLLLKRDRAISEIACGLGFSHQSHFTRHFKRLVGMTPKQFLQQL